MKKCSQCEKQLDESMFRKNSKSKDGLKSYCKICANTKYFPRKTVDLPEGEKRCGKCGCIKSFNQFTKTKRKLRGGVRSWCKECETQYYYEVSKSSPTIRESKRKGGIKYYQKNKNNRNAYCKKYHQENKDILNANFRKYYKENKDVRLERRIKNHEKCRLHSAKRRALKKTTDDGTITLNAIQTLYELQNHNCAICGCNLDELPSIKKNLDHIIPISKGGLHSIRNLQWTCQFCNYSKGAKELLESPQGITI